MNISSRSIRLLPTDMWQTNKNLNKIIDELSQKEKKNQHADTNKSTNEYDDSKEKDDNNPDMGARPTTSVDIRYPITAHYVTLLKQIRLLKIVLFVVCLFSNLITLGCVLLLRKKLSANTCGFLAVINGVIPVATTLAILR